MLRTAAHHVLVATHLRELGELVRRERPNVAHFHNTFPLITPSAYAACREQGVPVVQTLHNYRLVCCAATFFRDGRDLRDLHGRPALGRRPPPLLSRLDGRLAGGRVDAEAQLGRGTFQAARRRLRGIERVRGRTVRARGPARATAS